MLNEQLFALYHSHTQDLNALYANLDTKGIEDYAGPLLPYCWEEQCLRSRYQLVVFFLKEKA